MKNIKFISLMGKKKEVRYEEALARYPFFNAQINNFVLKPLINSGEHPLHGNVGGAKTYGDLFIFCDGSKLEIENKNAIASLSFVVCDRLGQIIYEEAQYTKKKYNYEMQAILKAASWLEKKEYRSATFFSDSLADIGHLQNFNSQRFQNKFHRFMKIYQQEKNDKTYNKARVFLEKFHIIEKIINLSAARALNRISVDFCYTPRQYNQRADKLAKELTQSYAKKVSLFLDKPDNISLIEGSGALSVGLGINLGRGEYSLKYKNHSSLILSKGENFYNIAPAVTEIAPLNKNALNTNFNTEKMIEDYCAIFEYLQKQDISKVNVFDSKLYALFDRKINIAWILNKEESLVKYKRFLNLIKTFNCLLITSAQNASILMDQENLWQTPSEQIEYAER